MYNIIIILYYILLISEWREETIIVPKYIIQVFTLNFHKWIHLKIENIIWILQIKKII